VAAAIILGDAFMPNLFVNSWGLISLVLSRLFVISVLAVFLFKYGEGIKK
jgi:hypothetical protein